MLGIMLKDKKKRTLIFILSYLLLLGGFFSYVNYVRNEELVEVTTKKEDKENVEEIKPVVVYFNIPTKIIGSTENPKLSYKQYRKRLNSNENVGYFLEQLRDDGEMKYEMTSYINEIKFDNINQITPPNNYVWQIYKLNSDGTSENITQNLNGLNLVDETTYEIRLDKNLDQQ